MDTKSTDGRAARAALLERRRAFERMSEWERLRGCRAPLEVPLPQLDELYELVSPEVRRQTPDPERAGVHAMQARLAVLSPSRHAPEPLAELLDEPGILERYQQGASA